MCREDNTGRNTVEERDNTGRNTVEERAGTPREDNTGRNTVEERAETPREDNTGRNTVQERALSNWRDASLNPGHRISYANMWGSSDIGNLPRNLGLLLKHVPPAVGGEIQLW